MRRCYFHEELDRPAVYTRTGYPHDDPSYDRLKAYMAEHSELKLGWGPNVVHDEAVEVEQYTEPVSADWERRVTVLHTPAGEFRASRMDSLRGQPGLPETYFIKGRADAERWLSLPMPTIGGDVSSFFARRAEVGDAGIVDVSLGRNPGGYVGGMLGSETLAMMSITDRDMVHGLCERWVQIKLAEANYLFDQGVGPFFSMAGQEFIAPPLHGPKDFWDFNGAYDKRINDLVHQRGGRMHVHCHGSLSKVFEAFVASGVDVLHPVEPPPMGDLPAKEAKRLAGDGLCIEGNIQIAHVYEHSPQEVRAETEALIADAFTDRKNLIVSTTASPWIRGEGENCFPRYKAMVEAVLNWRE